MWSFPHAPSIAPKRPKAQSGAIVKSLDRSIFTHNVNYKTIFPDKTVSYNLHYVKYSPLPHESFRVASFNNNHII